MEKIFGIDLGTTNSEIAYVKNGKPEVITIENGERYLPSVVGKNPSGQIVTGQTALNQYVAFPDDTVISIKREMGSGQKIVMAGESYTPADISSEILKALKKAAERETGLSVKKVVITVPAYFTDAQRKETIHAGELAGLDVVRIINEPTAAALAYGCREDDREKILVYDLGGGTFDVSIIDVEDDVLEVLGSDGDSLLGGDDFDHALEKLLISHLPEGSVKYNDLKLKARLKKAAESIKIELSTKTHVEVKEEFITTHNGKPVNLELVVTRKEFQDSIQEKLDKTFNLVQQVVNTANLRNSDISKVLLVGGSTYIPEIFTVLHNDLGFDVHRGIDPTYCVAVGAAIQGAIIAGEDIDTILIDVNSHSLGIRCLDIMPSGEDSDDCYSIIIHKNTPIPATMTKTYYTAMENQRVIQIDAFQGEDSVATNNTPIGSFALERLPKILPIGSEIEVTFEYTLNGIVEVSVFESISRKEEKIIIDINRMKIADDMSLEEEEDISADASVYKINSKKIERILKTARKKSKEIEDPEIINKIDLQIDMLEKAMISDEIEAGRISEELAELIAEV